MAEPADVKAWPEEEIPAADRLFYRVHASLLAAGKLVPGVFQERGGAMSTDWEKYSTPAQSLHRAKVYQDNGIVALIVGAVRQIDGVGVRHTPDWSRQNRAHSDVSSTVRGQMAPAVYRTMVRTRLLAVCGERWELPPPVLDTGNRS